MLKIMNTTDYIELMDSFGAKAQYATLHYGGLGLPVLCTGDEVLGLEYFTTSAAVIRALEAYGAKSKKKQE